MERFLDPGEGFRPEDAGGPGWGDLGFPPGWEQPRRNGAKGKAISDDSVHSVKSGATGFGFPPRPIDSVPEKIFFSKH